MCVPGIESSAAVRILVPARASALLTPAPDTRVCNQASGPNSVRRSRLDSSRSDLRSGRRGVRVSLLLPALALLLGALSPSSAAQAQTKTLSITERAGAAGGDSGSHAGASADDDHAGVRFIGVNARALNQFPLRLNASRAYRVVLTARPVADVTIKISARFGVTVSPASHTFSARSESDWSSPKEFTVTGARLGAAFISHSLTSADRKYASLADADWDPSSRFQFYVDPPLPPPQRLTIADDGEAVPRQRTESLKASFERAMAAHDGAEAFTLNVRFSEALGETANTPAKASFAVQGGKVERVAQLEANLWQAHIAPKAWRDVTVTLAGGRACGVAGAVCTADGRSLTNTSTVTVGGPVRIRVESARAKEGRDASLDFAVTLSRAASQAVSVEYATADGTAMAGADYTATSGTLTFAPGETAKTVPVPILDDAIDEGKEKLVLRMSNPRGAYLRKMHRRTVGLIVNDDPLQAMWLARFGRMVASDAVASVTARLETPRDAGSHVTVAGQRMNFGEAEGGEALATVLTGFAQTFGAPSAPAADKDDPFARHRLTSGWDDPATATGARRVRARELLLGTSFRAVFGQGAGSQWTSWGQGASVSRFSAAVPGLGLTGESATGSTGMDYERGRLLMGFAMTHSVGEGTANDAGWRYALGSTATMAMPYARLALSDRISVWGLAGTGSGRLSLDLDSAVPQSYRTDLAMTLAATGVRGDLVTPAEPGGFALALKADAFWVRTESDRVTAAEFGSLMGARGESSRVRAVLDGSRTFSFASGAALTPKLELGVRHDAGDAETGTGMELGAGLGYADPSRGLDMALKVHGLAVHAEDGYEEWGVSGQLRLVPGGAGRGLSASLTPSYGVDPAGSERLWALPASSGLTANGAANGAAEPSSRFDAEVGYGMSLLGDRFTGTPNVGLGLSDRAREVRMGWRLTSAVPGDPGFEVGLDATRREAENDNGEAEHGVMLRSLVRW